MLSGQVQVTFGTSASTIEYVRAGTLRALAVTTATRSELLPELPTIADFVPGYEAYASENAQVPAGRRPHYRGSRRRADSSRWRSGRPPRPFEVLQLFATPLPLPTERFPNIPSSR
jgi:hypothetical protein